MKKKEKKSNHYPLYVRVFQVVATVLFALVLLFSTLSLATSKQSLKSMCNKYVRGVELNEEYFGNFTDSGWSREETESFLTDDKIYHLLSGVMTDRMLALFRYSDSYEYDLEGCKAEIKALISDYNEKYGNNMSDSKISSLAAYTCDISGLSAMFVYDTPLAYRTALSGTENTESVKTDTRILETFALLSRWYFIASIVVMFLIILGILIYIHKEHIYPVLADTVLHPSLLFLALSIGERFGLPDNPVVTDHVFLCLGLVSLIGVIIGVFLYLIARNIQKWDELEAEKSPEE